MSKILITGAGGFIGSHLVERCVSEGFGVRAFVRYNAKNTWGWLEKSDCRKDIEVISGDIRDYDSVHSAAKGCHAIFHLAALIGIPYSYVSPLAYIRTNVEGTYNVLQAAISHDIGNVLVTSTSETYGTARFVPINEDHPLVGQSPYSASKISADQLAISYYSSFGLPVKIVRPFNAFGPRQSARAIIPSIVIQILNNKKEISVGNITPTRDFTYVSDTVDGFLEIFHSKSLVGQATNIGMNEETSIGNLIETIAGMMGATVEVKTDPLRIRPVNSEVERLRCDNTKLLTQTGWKPKRTFRDGLEETIVWLKNNAELYKTDIYNV